MPFICPDGFCDLCIVTAVTYAHVSHIRYRVETRKISHLPPRTSFQFSRQQEKWKRGEILLRKDFDEICSSLLVASLCVLPLFWKESVRKFESSSRQVCYLACCTAAWIQAFVHSSSHSLQRSMNSRLVSYDKQRFPKWEKLDGSSAYKNNVYIIVVWDVSTTHTKCTKITRQSQVAYQLSGSWYRYYMHWGTRVKGVDNKSKRT